MSIRETSSMKLVKAGDLLSSGGAFQANQTVRLATAAGSDPRYLDGNQYTGTVQTVDKAALLSPGFTGINWLLQPAARGMWRLLNQGDANYGLIVQKDIPCLSRLRANHDLPDPTGHWMIYTTEKPGCFMLRPVKAAWLKLNEERDRVVLGTCASDDERSAWWNIHLLHAASA